MSYYRPERLSDALEILALGDGKIVAGGTDFYPSTKPGQTPAALVDITRVAGLSQITHSAEGTLFGAAVTWSDIIAADLPPAFYALKAAGREVGSIQIQNSATLVGNICNASPAADGVPPLLALDASVQIASVSKGTRSLKLDEFITGVRRIDLAKDEIVSGIFVPACDAGARSAFQKLGSRRYLVISICMTAVTLVLNDAGEITHAKIAVGACSAVAQRLRGLEQDVLGQDPNTVQIKPEHLSELSPIDDVRGTAEYRLDVVAEQIRRAIKEAAKI